MAETTQSEGSGAVKGTRRARRVRTGVVSSAKGDKTITVQISRLMRHAKYGKYLKRAIKLHAHDEKNEARAGDIVEIVECRPISKTKSWRLFKCVTKAADR